MYLFFRFTRQIILYGLECTLRSSSHPFLSIINSSSSADFISSMNNSKWNLIIDYRSQNAARPSAPLLSNCKFPKPKPENPQEKVSDRSCDWKQAATVVSQMDMEIEGEQAVVKDEDLFKAAENGDSSIFEVLSHQQLLKSLSLRNEDRRSLLHVAASSARSAVK